MLSRRAALSAIASYFWTISSIVALAPGSRMRSARARALRSLARIPTSSLTNGTVRSDVAALSGPILGHMAT